MSGSWSLIFQDFVSLFYPNYCLSCEEALMRGERLLCSRCLLELPRTNFHKDQANEFLRRLQYQQSIKSAVALFKFTKNGKVQNLLHALKYRNHPEIGLLLGAYYGEQLKNEWKTEKPDLLIPIPLHWQKLRKRGYNQSEEFAKGLSEVLSVKMMPNALIRNRFTETQTRKSKLSRWENVATVFEVIDKRAIEGRSVALVDDVVTTGATIESASDALINSGCRDISVISLAYAAGA